MNHAKSSLKILLTISSLVILNSCDAFVSRQSPISNPVSPSPSNSPTEPANPTSQGPPAPVPVSPSPGSPNGQSPIASGDKLTVTLYQADSQCSSFAPKQVQVSPGRSLDDTISQIIQAQNNTDLKISGYTVQLSGGAATIDLSRTADSKRKFESLSTCEQLSLFGSLTETLTKNSELKVKSVTFTEKGEEILF
jgi:hypothetical protein